MNRITLSAALLFATLAMGSTILGMAKDHKKESTESVDAKQSAAARDAAHSPQASAAQTAAGGQVVVPIDKEIESLFNELVKLIEDKISLTPRLKKIKKKIGAQRFIQLLNYVNSSDQALLFQAVQLRNHEAVTELIIAGANADLTSKKGTNALCIALTLHDFTSVKLLIKKGKANVNLLLPYHLQPGGPEVFRAPVLYIAIFLGLPSKVIRYLLEEAHADVMAGDVMLSQAAERWYNLRKDMPGLTHLPDDFHQHALRNILTVKDLFKKHEATQKISDEKNATHARLLPFSQEFEKRMADGTQKSLSRTKLETLKTAQNNAEILRSIPYIFDLIATELKKYVFDIHELASTQVLLTASQFKQLLNYEDENGDTLLILACNGANIPYIRSIAAQGTEINYVSRKKQCTALSRSIMGGDVPLIEALMALRANVNQMIDGVTPLMLAIHSNNPALVRAFLNNPTIDLFNILDGSSYHQYAERLFAAGKFTKDSTLSPKQIKDLNLQIIKLLKEAEANKIIERKQRAAKRDEIVARLNNKALLKKKEEEAALLLEKEKQLKQHEATARSVETDAYAAYLKLSPEQRNIQDEIYNAKIKAQLKRAHDEIIKAQEDALLAENQAQQLVKEKERLAQERAENEAREKAIQDKIAYGNELARKLREKERSERSNDPKKVKAHKKTAQSESSTAAAQTKTETATAKPQKMSEKEIEREDLDRNLREMARTQAKIDKRREFIKRIEKIEKKAFFTEWKKFVVAQKAKLKNKKDIMQNFLEHLRVQWHEHQDFLAQGNAAAAIAQYYPNSDPSNIDAKHSK